MASVKEAYASIESERIPHECYRRGVRAYALGILKKLMDGDSETANGDTPLNELNLMHVTHHCDGDKYPITAARRRRKSSAVRAMVPCS